MNEWKGSEMGIRMCLARAHVIVFREHSFMDLSKFRPPKSRKKQSKKLRTIADSNAMCQWIESEHGKWKLGLALSVCTMYTIVVELSIFVRLELF